MAWGTNTLLTMEIRHCVYQINKLRPLTRDVSPPPSYNARTPATSGAGYYSREWGTSYYPFRQVSEVRQAYRVPERQQRVHHTGRQGKTPAMGTYLHSVGSRLPELISPISVPHVVLSFSTLTLTLPLMPRSYYAGSRNETRQ